MKIWSLPTLDSIPLLINNGDGTFTTRLLEGSDDLKRMPASVAMGDLNGDHLPDLFEVNYIQDANIARTPQRDERGNVVEPVGPGIFLPPWTGSASTMAKVGVRFADDQ